jgi:hypothetical protein
VYHGLVRGGDSYDVFVSYSRADSAAAESLRARLKEVGLSAFLDRYGLPAGQPWQPWLERQLSSCRALVALVGPEGLGEWQHREIELGLDRQASAAKAGGRFPVIPVLLPGLANDAVPVGSFLSLNTWVDLRSGLDEPESLQRLVAGAQEKAIDAAAAQKLLAGLAPYRGLLPFREQDAGLFFGRERFVEELVRKVGQHSAANVVAVIGRSGSGKSSIVYAGLFPALRRERGVGDQSVWQIVDLRPQDEPLHMLALAFDPPKAELGSIDFRKALNKRAQSFRDREVTLADLVRDRLQKDKGSTRLLLYVDQWEELYTQAPRREVKKDEDPSQPAKDAKLFIDLVLEAAANSPCTLVLSVRSDFYPDIQNHDGLRKAVQENQVSLGTMNEAELRAVIEGPPKALGASVDQKLTQELIRDIGLDPASGRSDEYDIGKLPLLEYALEQAWPKRKDSRIGPEHYSGLEQALEERANALYGRLSAEEQAVAKRLFVSLVTPGEGREDTRARIDMPNDDAMRRVIQTFAAGEPRLIVTDRASERGSVEVTHEALIRHWDKLRAWIDENRDKLRTREFLKGNRAEWLKRDRDPDLLNLPSLYVEAARSLCDEPGDVVIDDIKDYIDALLDHDRQQKEAEEQKRHDELERAKERAESAQRLAEALRKAKEAAEDASREAAARAAVEADLRAAAEQKVLAEQQAKTAAEDAARQAAARAAAESERAEAARRLADVRARSAETERGLRELAEGNAKKARQRSILATAAAVLLLLVALVAVGAAWVAYQQKALAEEQKAAARNNETHALAALSRAAAREGRPLDGVELALAAWPRRSGDMRPMLGDALRYLSLSLSEHPPVAVLNHGDTVWGAVYSPDGKRILSWSDDKTLRVWDAAAGVAWWAHAA